MKNFLLALCFMIPLCCLHGQTADSLSQDLVILKGQAQIQGQVKSITSKYVVFYDGASRYVIKKENIERLFYKGSEVFFSDKKIISAPLEDLSDMLELVPYKQTEKRGFYNVTYLGLHFPSDNNYGGLGGVNVTGYQLTRYTGIGLGFGFIDSGNYWTGNSMPVFAEYRGYFTDRKASMYYSIAMGINFGIKDRFSFVSKLKPGSYFHPAVGYKIGSDKSSFMIDLGYHYSTITATHDDGSLLYTYYFAGEEQRNLTAGFVLRIGIML